MGLALSKHHPGLFLLSHIYNACHQTELLSARWAQLDEVIEQHIGVIFAGEPSNKIKHCLKRLHIRAGTSVTEFAKDNRNKSGKRKLRHWGPEMLPTKASAIFRRSFSQGITLQQCLYQHDLLSTSASTRLRREVSKRQFTLIQLLSHIQDYLRTTFKALNIDYINLIKSCNKILL